MKNKLNVTLAGLLIAASLVAVQAEAAGNELRHKMLTIKEIYTPLCPTADLNCDSARVPRLDPGDDVLVLAHAGNSVQVLLVPGDCNPVVGWISRSVEFSVTGTTKNFILKDMKICVAKAAKGQTD